MFFIKSKTKIKVFLKFKSKMRGLEPKMDAMDPDSTDAFLDSHIGNGHFGGSISIFQI